MKKIALILITIPLIFCQDYSWTWLSGSKNVNQPGNYSLYGLASSIVFPGARYASSSVFHPVKNEFVIFGGYNPGNIYFNDLWSYNISYGQWTWLRGSDKVNQPGVYGTRGSESPSNIISSRSDHGMVIHPVSNYVIVFGGWGYSSEKELGYLNDLWAFDFETNHWTWLDGSTMINQVGNYVSQGVQDEFNFPGGRYSSSLIIHPASDKLILFGGYASGYLNDLWSYDLNVNYWTWLGGSERINQPAVYGNKGSSSPFNSPGARAEFGSSINTLTGELMIFGGRSNSNWFNDLWSYNFETALWTWVSGSNASYPTNTRSFNKSEPGGRYGHSMSFIENLNSVVVFGGCVIGGYVSDLWLLDLTLNEWTLHSGSFNLNSKGSYGIMGTLNSTNAPGSRYFPTFSCSKAVRKCFLFGGYGYASSRSVAGSLNDLWVLDLPFPRESVAISSSSSSLSPSSSLWLSTDREDTSTTSVETEDISYSIDLTDEDVSLQTLAYLNITNHKTTRAHGEKTTPFKFNPRQTILSLSVLVIGIVLLFFSLWFCIARVSQSVRQSKPIETTAVNENHSATMDSQTSFSNGGITSMSTQFNADQGISIPGFLQFKNGIDFRVLSEIARGGMGSVCLGDVMNPALCKYGKTIVVKQNLQEKLQEKEIKMFYQEISIMYYLSGNRNIAKIVGYSEQPFCLLMKYYPEGSLKSWIKSKTNVKTLSLIISFLLDISNGIFAMHSKDLVHCDLKPQNILLDHDPSRLFCVIADFGITQIVSEENLSAKDFKIVKTNGASFAYSAPEAIMRYRLGKNSPVIKLFYCDIYAFGIILCELLIRKSLWRIKKQ